jgi:outer membrane protein assembly factor BamB
LKQKNTIEFLVLLIIMTLGIVVFFLWFFHNPVKDLSTSMPGLDNRPLADSTAVDSVVIGEKFKEYETFSSSLTGKWPRFRGADFDNIYKGGEKLIEKFDTSGPKILWTVELGEGHAAPVIYNGRVYLLDYDERKRNDALRCFSLETGKELWRRWYAVKVKRNHGMSRTVPAITDKYIVTMGPKCHVMCCDPLTGDFLWGMDLVKEFKTEVPLWYTGQCPLIDNDIAILAPGGSSLLIGVDCKTGKIVWNTPNPGNMKMSHSSVMPMTFAGKKMYVYAAIGGVCGISAEGSDVGKILWRQDKFNPSVMAPSPLVMPDGKIFLTAGYGAGAALLQLVKNGENFEAKVLQIYKPSEGLASEQQTPLFYKGFVFGILPKDAGPARNQFVCCSPDDTRKILWTSSKTDRYGLGPYIIADGKFFILSDDGELTIAKATTTGFVFLDKAKIMDGQDAWGPMAIADGRLILRDSKLLVCIDIQKK